MIFKNIKHSFKLWKNTFYLKRKYDVLIEKSVTIKYPDTITIGEGSTFQSGVYIYGSRNNRLVRFGEKVVLAAGSVIYGEGGVELGDFTHIAPGVIILAQYADKRKDMGSELPNLRYLPVKIGKGCWIGAGSIILPGKVVGKYFVF